MPLVSVLTATYNRRELLGEAIASVLAQNFDDWEMLVLDDGSEPGARPIVVSFADSRLRYIPLNHAGLPTARNHGLVLARGEYIAFLDDDDLYHPEKLAVEVAHFNANPDIDIVGSGYRLVGNGGLVHHIYEPWRTNPNLSDRNIIFGVPLIPCSVLVKRRAIDRLSHWFDPAFSDGLGDDTDFFIRLFLAGARFGWIEEILSDYRRLDQRDGTFLIKSWRIYHQVYDKVFQSPGLPPEIVAQKHRALVNLDLHYAWAAFAMGAPQTGRHLLLQALAREPELTNSEADMLIRSLVAFSQNKAFIDDPYSFIDRVLAHLPSLLAHFSKQERQIKHLAAREDHAFS